MVIMERTPYQQKMDLLGLQEHNLFEIIFFKVVHIVSALSTRYAVDDALDERTFLLRTVTRMTNLMNSVYTLFKTTKDRASMMILTRSIIDLNAIIVFLFRFVKDNDERALRLCLYYLDGVRTRIEFLKEPLKERDSRYISEEEYNATLCQMEKAKKADTVALKDLENRILSSPLFPRMHSGIFKKASWKYKKIDDKESYSWADLYEIACGEKKMAGFEQKYLSHYVHGIAISDFQFSSINETNPVFSLNICCTILNPVDQLIKEWFPNDYNDLEKEFKLQMGEKLLSRLSPDSLNEYLKRLDYPE